MPPVTHKYPHQSVGISVINTINTIAPVNFFTFIVPSIDKTEKNMS